MIYGVKNKKSHEEIMAEVKMIRSYLNSENCRTERQKWIDYLPNPYDDEEELFDDGDWTRDPM